MIKRMILGMSVAAIMAVSMAGTALAEEQGDELRFAPPGVQITCQAVKWYPGWQGSPGYYYQWCHSPQTGWYISYS
jgi:hypothetical protein